MLDPDGNRIEFSAELELVDPDRPAGIWPKEPDTLNRWGEAFMRERLLVQSAHGAAESARELPFPVRFIMRSMLLRGPFQDKDRMEKIVVHV